VRQEMRDVLVIVVLFVALTLSTFALAKGLWLCGVRTKDRSFKQLWLAVSCFFTSVIAVVGFAMLVCWI